jgi:hypothetical protein
MEKGGTAVRPTTANRPPGSKWPHRVQQQFNSTAPAISLIIGGVVLGGTISTTFASSSFPAIWGAVLGAVVGLAIYFLARIGVRRKS